MPFGTGYYWGFDPTYLLIIIGLLICVWASASMNSTFSRYSRIENRSRITGAEAAQRILQYAGIHDVHIERTGGNLTDHYDPRTKVLRLSGSVYGSTSVAAVCVAAHECGHAVQHNRQYLPLTVRGAIVPAANLGSALSWPLFFAGLIFSGPSLLTLGIVLFTAAVAFQLVTLPVETNASRRALAMLQETGILREEELRGGRKVLKAAALTYVAALASSILQLLRLLILAGGARRDD